MRLATLVVVLAMSLACMSLGGVAGVAASPTATAATTPPVTGTDDPSASVTTTAHTGGDRWCPAPTATAFPSDSPNSSSTTDTDPGTEPPIERGVDTPTITAVYPNPTIDGNVGEYFVLETPADTNLEGWSITDGHATASLPNETVDGAVAVTMAPEETATLTDLRPIELEGHLPLAADGDELTLLENGTERDQVAYERAPTAQGWYRGDGKNATGEEQEIREGSETGAWWPKNASCFPVGTYDDPAATTFVLPDSPEVSLELIADADDRILIAGYTLTHPTLVAELEAALERGVAVEVLVEAGPVGGTPEATDRKLSELEAAGATVSALGGSDARYRFHHPKYAIVDDAVLVASENWNPAGMGGASSRGWGTVVEDAALASDLEAVFRADADGWDVTPWGVHRETATFVEHDDPTASYPAEHPVVEMDLESVELLVAPDNAEGRLLEYLDDADDEILIKQAAIGGEDLSVLEAALEAAERGVDVRVLLDASWYNEDENRAIVDSLEAQADRDGLPLEARLVEAGDQFEKIHAKGVVIDGEVAIVGSLNWNENALENNREVVLALHGEEAGAYYGAVFEADWKGDGDGPLGGVPIELLVVVLIAIIAAAVLGWQHCRFEQSAPKKDEDERIYF